MKITKGHLDAGGLRFGIVVSKFNELITSRLLGGALEVLTKAGAEDQAIEVAEVPGAFEIPTAARLLLARTDGVVGLGCVIRGETVHFEHVAGQAAAGIREAGQTTGVPVTFGVLTTETLEQALDRAGGKHGNKGWDAATAAIEMSSLLEQLPKEAEP